MGAIRDAFDTVYRDFVTPGVSASGRNEPDKSLVRSLGTTIEQFLTASGIDTIYESTALGIAGTPEGMLFLVQGDGVNSFADLIAKIRAGSIYVNVHTVRNGGGGEIRGQLLEDTGP